MPREAHRLKTDDRNEEIGKLSAADSSPRPKRMARLRMGPERKPRDMRRPQPRYEQRTPAMVAAKPRDMRRPHLRKGPRSREAHATAIPLPLRRPVGRRTYARRASMPGIACRRLTASYRVLPRENPGSVERRRREPRRFTSRPRPDRSAASMPSRSPEAHPKEVGGIVEPGTRLNRRPIAAVPDPQSEARRRRPPAEACGNLQSRQFIPR